VSPRAVAKSDRWLFLSPPCLLLSHPSTLEVFLCLQADEEY